MQSLELLIVGIDELPDNAGNDWLAPEGMLWQFEMRSKMPWYIVPGGKYSYSWEPSGIQLLFEETMRVADMLQIAGAIVTRLCHRGYPAQLMVIDTGNGLPIRFEA